MQTVTVSPKFQVVIPLAVRQHLKLVPGVKLQVVQLLTSQRNGTLNVGVTRDVA